MNNLIAGQALTVIDIRQLAVYTKRAREKGSECPILTSFLVKVAVCANYGSFSSWNTY